MTITSLPTGSYSIFNGYIIDASLVVTDISSNFTTPYSKININMHVYSTLFDASLVDVRTKITNFGTGTGLIGSYTLDISQNIYSQASPGPFVSALIPHGNLLAGTDISYSTITVNHNNINGNDTLTSDGSIALGMDVSGTNIPSGTKIINYTKISGDSTTIGYTRAGTYTLSKNVGSSFRLTQSNTIGCSVDTFSWYGCIGLDGSTNMIVFDSPNRVNYNSAQLSSNGLVVPFPALELGIDVSVNGITLPSTNHVGTKIINMPSLGGGFGKYTLNHGVNSPVGAKINASIFTIPSGETRLIVYPPVVGTITIGHWIGYETGPPTIKDPIWAMDNVANFTSYTLQISSGPFQFVPALPDQYYYILSGGPTLSNRFTGAPSRPVYSGPLIEGILY
jgi:hypothetical protein